MALDLNALEPPPAVAAASAPPEAAPPLASQPPSDQMGAIPAGQAPMAPMVPQQREDPNQMERAHESVIGRAFRHLAGREMTYSVDPTTGKTVATPVEQKPGQFFRSILAGAILGGAMGTGSGGVAQGVSKGGAAVGEQQQRNDLIKREQAQQDYKNTLERERTNMEKERLTIEQSRANQQNILNAAQVASLNQEMAMRHHTMDLQDQDRIEAHNTSMRGLEKIYQDANGRAVQLPTKDGFKTVVTGGDIAAAITKDPKVLNGGPGTHRVFLDTTNLSEIEFNGKQWVDKSGHPVDMTDKSTVKAFDIPNDEMNKESLIPNQRIIDTYGVKGNPLGLDPKGQSSMSPVKMMALADRGAKLNAEKGAAKVAENKAALDLALVGKQIKLADLDIKRGNHYEAQTTIDAAKVQISGVQDLLRAAQSSGLGIDKDKLKEYEKDIKDATDQMNASLAEIKAKGGPVKPSGKTVGEPVTLGQQINGVTLDGPTAQVYASIQKTGSTPNSYDMVASIPAVTTDGQRVTLASAFGIPIPRKVVAAMAAARKVAPETMAQQLQANGAKIEESGGTPSWRTATPGLQ